VFTQIFEYNYTSFPVMEVVKNEMILLGKLPSMKILLRDNNLPVLEYGISVAMERGGIVKA